MKKAIYIFLAALYLFSTVGLTVVTHFCGDEVESITVVSSKAAEEPEDCCGVPCESGCCENETISLKLDDTHKTEINWEPESLKLIASLSSENLSELLKVNSITFNPFYNDTSPPKTQIYKFNCTLLI